MLLELMVRSLRGGTVGVFCELDFPKVVKAVEETPNKTIKTAKSIVRLPHCVNLFSGWYMV